MHINIDPNLISYISNLFFALGTPTNALRFVTPSQQDESRQVVENFSLGVQYYPVSTLILDQIKVEIRDSSGSFIKFKDDVRLVLHFKPRYNNNGYN